MTDQHENAAPRQRSGLHGGWAVLTVVLVLLLLAGAAFAIGRTTAPSGGATPAHPGTSISLPYPMMGARDIDQADLAWMRSHMGEVAWLRGHPQDWTWMREHAAQWRSMMGDRGMWQWMVSHRGQWPWMREHWRDIAWMHNHWRQWDNWRTGRGYMPGGGPGWCGRGWNC